VVRTLLAHHADANMVQHGTKRTALHIATLANWLEGVDALLAPGVDCQVLRDADNHTALDYARQQEIFDLLRDYIETLYPTWTEEHPVSFDFGLSFDEGVWKLQQVRPLAWLMYTVNHVNRSCD
jgi:hypothetical protein